MEVETYITKKKMRDSKSEMCITKKKEFELHNIKNSPFWVGERIFSLGIIE
jgi:hypothetical protein